MEDKTPAQIETDCLNEINEVLKKYNCVIEVTFSQDTVLGTPVLKYLPTVVFKGKEGGKQSCEQL